MSEVKTQNYESFGHALIETGVEGCFSGTRLTVEFLFGETAAAAVKISRAEQSEVISLKRLDAERFLSKIIKLARKIEVLTGWRTTTHYFAGVEWKNLSFVEGATSGKIHDSSSEWTTQQIEEIWPTIKDTAISGKVKKLLKKGLHRRAIEIYLETNEFAKSHLKQNVNPRKSEAKN